MEKKQEIRVFGGEKFQKLYVKETSKSSLKCKKWMKFMQLTYLFIPPSHKVMRDPHSFRCTHWKCLSRVKNGTGVVAHQVKLLLVIHQSACLSHGYSASNPASCRCSLEAAVTQEGDPGGLLSSWLSPDPTWSAVSIRIVSQLMEDIFLPSPLFFSVFFFSFPFFY